MKKTLGFAALAASAVFFMFGCGDSNDSGSSNNGSSNSSISKVSFEELPLPQSDDEITKARVSSKLTVTYNDGSTKEYPLSFKVLMKSGDKIGNGTFGLLIDKDGNPILNSDGSYYISNNPDGSSLVNIGDKTYLVTHLEERPGEIYMTEIKEENSELKAVDTKPIDFSPVGGTIINCASSETPYGSHLGGEEDYSLNTRYADPNSPFYVDCEVNENNEFTGNDASGTFNYFCSYVAGMQKYLQDYNIDKTNGYNGDAFTPYNYGYIVEVQSQEDGSVKVAKHYVTGKYTPELAVMMPDQKTVYMTDDGTAKGFYKFVSDEKINGFTPEWEGTLYAAKVTQLSDANGGEFKIEWIKLGHAKDSEIKAMIDSKMKLTDIFDIEKPDENGNCSTGFKKVYEDGEVECLKLKDGMEKAAAFLETRKYAAYMGATTEFRKEEGIIYNPDKNVLYVAMSAIEKSMEDNYKGIEPVNDIRLPKNKCGAVYEISLDSNYNATHMKAIVVGKPLEEGDQYADKYYCDPNSIANPDNINYIGHNILLIGEDTTKHVNNMVWAYDTEEGTLTRIAQVPIGAEVTGVFAHGIVGNKGVIMLQAQHPFEDNPKAADGSKPYSYLLEQATDEQKRGIIGYIDGIPAELFNK